MNSLPECGDLARSLAGRDKGKVFLVIRREGKIAYIADGKTRKVNSLKKKNVKHLSTVQVAADIETAMKIRHGGAVANDKIVKIVNAAEK